MFVLYLVFIYLICKFYYNVEENINNYIYIFFVSKLLRWLYVKKKKLKKKEIVNIFFMGVVM